MKDKLMDRAPEIWQIKLEKSLGLKVTGKIRPEIMTQSQQRTSCIVIPATSGSEPELLDLEKQKQSHPNKQ